MPTAGSSTDPDVPPMPPHISFEHASNYLRAMLKGDVDAWSTLRASFHDMVESYLPQPAGR
jgi:pyruvate dehydrogenase (quinone)